MQVKIQESWTLYDKPNDRCMIRFIQGGQEVVRIVFNFTEGKSDYFSGNLSDYYPITNLEEKRYINDRRESAMRRTRGLKL